jgi:hypothetical protein
LTPEGKIVGTMGTGFSQNLRKKMLQDPDRYVGRVARAKAEAQFPSGALRVPAFKGWHTEKSEEKMFKEGTIREQNGKFELVSSKNKVLGTHDTREGAIRQERAIQLSKKRRSARQLLAPISRP